MLHLLDEDSLIEILGFLKPSEVVNFCCTASCFRDFLHNDGVWQTLCWSVWGISSKPDDQSWKNTFMSYINEIGPRYMNCYRRVASLWARLEKWSEQYQPQIKQSLLGPLTESRVQTLLQRCPFADIFPIEYILFCRFHNGQKECQSQRDFFTGLLGGFSFYDFVSNSRFVNFETAVQYALNTAPRFRAFPFASSFTHATYYLIDGQGRVVRPFEAFREFHVVSNSFLEFMEDHATRLEEGVFELEGNGQINRFPLRAFGNSDTTTNGIRIQVSVLFVPEASSAEGPYLFTYRVTITCVSETLRPCRLTTRTWKVTDETGHVDEVHGPGVIGRYPDMYPGVAPFHYESCTKSDYRTGRMEGSFQFRYVDSNEEFDALIQPFYFDVSRTCT
eukprot:TRINITY_DN7411_c0_g1_i1.p1 TRINITY_DN7411_c0_g1~~TRINITY_DN7411_c0_g1_i1.p1  ORF type:complete len:390 (-),score=13.37 TRINITY_DN7411_c0_g1_i1:75-1244(-)